MASPLTTAPQSRPGSRKTDGPAEPGVAVIYMGGRPVFHAQALLHGVLEVGRGELHARVAGKLGLDDARVSREHLTVRHDKQGWHVRDAGGRNGTQIDGEDCKGDQSADGATVVRAGSSLLLLLDDVRPMLDQSVEVRGDVVLGPTLQAAFDEISRAAKVGETLHLSGESGTGKELAARHFHAVSKGASKPFVAVNCAGIPQGISERLFFGARRGAYSGADKDAEGYLTAANEGTLFLDEVGELDPAVQPKLLRALETQEVLPLGATRPLPTRFALCSATHRELRTDVGGGTFRQDLYFRLGRPSLTLPPLRDRLEELPWLVSRATRHAHVTFIEACLLREWPGNVRELLAEVKASSAAAGAAAISAEHLFEGAGRGFAEGAAAVEQPSREKLLEVVEAHQGNVSAAARSLKIHRTQLRRWLGKP